MKNFFTPKEVAEFADISYRQIQYWDKTNFIKPSRRREGKYREYTFRDLVQLRIAKLLKENGYSIQGLRKTLKVIRELLPKINFPLSECNLLIEGEKILVFNGDVLMDPCQRQDFVRFDARELRHTIEAKFNSDLPATG